MKALELAVSQKGCWRKIPWVLKKSVFSQNSQNFGDRKCLPEVRTSLVGLPNAKFF
jgi:hypothetical protein